MTADLSALIARLEAAEVGGRELDWRIAEAFDIPETWKVAVGIWPPFMERSKFDQSIPAFTTSLDAAIALAERVHGEARALDLLQDVVALHDPHGLAIREIPRLLCSFILRAKQGEGE